MRCRLLVEINGNYVNIPFDYSNLSILEKKEGTLNDSRLTLEGDIKVTSAEYDLIQSSINNILNFVFWADGQIVCSGTFDKLQKNDVYSKVLTFKVKNTDKYTLFDKFGNTKYNIVAVPSLEQTSEYLFLQDNFELFRTQSNLTDPYEIIGNPWEESTVLNTNPGESYGLMEIREYLEQEINSFTFVRASVIWGRVRGYGFYEGTIAQPPNSGTWYYAYDLPINGINIPVFYRPVQAASWELTTTGTHTPGELYSTSIGDIGLNNLINYYTHEPRRLDEVLKFIVQSFDPTINFDFSEFTFFNTFASQNVSHDYLVGNIGFPGITTPFASNLPYKDMLIMPLSGAIPQNDGFQQVEKSTQAQLSFNSLWNFFADKSFLFYLDDTNTFIIRHFTEISQINQSLFIPNTQTLEIIEYTEPTFFKVQNGETCSGLDMQGVETEFYNVNSTDTFITSSAEIFTDIDDIRALKTDGYSDTNNELFCIVCTDYDAINKVYYLRDENGLLSGVAKNNSNLGFPFVQKHLFSEVPSNSAKINGIVETLNDNRLMKNKTVKVEIPYVNIDFSKNIRIFGKSFQIVSQKTKCNSYRSEIELIG